MSKLYLCDYKKNKKCKKNNCFFSSCGCCYMTTDKRFKLNIFKFISYIKKSIKEYNKYSNNNKK